MTKTNWLTASALIAAGILCSSTAVAQTANAFGATIRNPGSITPEWWNEVAYIPERLEGALHLRMGSSGNFGGSPFVGRANCDMSMLYAAKSNTPMSQSELEYCALLEFELYQGTSGKKRDLRDTFVRKDTIAEFSEVIKNRIELFRQNDSYYLRAAAVQLDPFDLAQGGMVMRLNWTQGYVPADPKAGRPSTIMYKFDDPHFRKSDDRWWGIRLMDNEQGGREIEQARTGGKFVTAMNFFVFDVTGVREIKDASSITRYIKVQVRHFGIPYVTADGRTVVTGIKQ
ncbi:hypothetical protein [Undibacterium sp.]|uniref:hypothetical protein n=1 Tax=Undibacterium sp. TaxID=1914977 RepID=UPI00374D8DA7